MENNKNIMNRSGKVWAGLLIIIVGSLLLLDNFGFNLPHWLFHWSNILIIIGLFVGIKHNFRNSGWFVMIMIGLFFTLRDALGDQIDFSKVVFPVMLVTLGLFIIFKPKSTYVHGKRCKKKFGDKIAFENFPEADPDLADKKKMNSNDYIDSVNVFGGSHQAIYSKDFKGGDITAVFGGCDLNLTQADFEGEIVLDVTAVFGGCKIIIPPGWQVKSEVTAIFGGLDDKRSVLPVADEKQRLLIIKGIAMFGGVDIRNY